MRSPLNSPLEVGVRVLTVLNDAFPDAMDVNRLVLLDHAMLHSADLGGPESLHPPVPVRAGELGVKRRAIELGLEVMVRGGLVDMMVSPDGLDYRASDDAGSFVEILESEYAARLRDRATWVVERFGSLSDDLVRAQMRRIFEAWSEEFELLRDRGAGG